MTTPTPCFPSPTPFIFPSTCPFPCAFFFLLRIHKVQLALPLCVWCCMVSTGAPSKPQFPPPQQTCPQLPSEECGRERTPIYVRISSDLISRSLEQVTTAAESVLTRRRGSHGSSHLCCVLFDSFPQALVAVEAWVRENGSAGACRLRCRTHVGLSPRAPYLTALTDCASLH